MDRPTAIKAMNNVRDLLDDNLEQAEQNYHDHHGEDDLEITLMDHNMKGSIIETDTHWEWTVPVKVRIAK